MSSIERYAGSDLVDPRPTKRQRIEHSSFSQKQSVSTEQTIRSESVTLFDNISANYQSFPNRQGKLQVQVLENKDLFRLISRYLLDPNTFKILFEYKGKDFNALYKLFQSQWKEIRAECFESGRHRSNTTPTDSGLLSSKFFAWIGEKQFEELINLSKMCRGFYLTVYRTSSLAQSSTFMRLKWKIACEYEHSQKHINAMHLPLCNAIGHHRKRVVSEFCQANINSDTLKALLTVNFPLYTPYNHLFNQNNIYSSYLDWPFLNYRNKNKNTIVQVQIDITVMIINKLGTLYSELLSIYDFSFNQIGYQSLINLFKNIIEKCTPEGRVLFLYNISEFLHRVALGQYKPNKDTLQALVEVFPEKVNQSLLKNNIYLLLGNLEQRTAQEEAVLFKFFKIEADSFPDISICAQWKQDKRKTERRLQRINPPEGLLPEVLFSEEYWSDINNEIRMSHIREAQEFKVDTRR